MGAHKAGCECGSADTGIACRCKRATGQRAQWAKLRIRIRDFTSAAIAESWKGGGDPADMPIIDKELELATLKLNLQLDKMERDAQ